jgi:hypothetical protein
MAVSDQTTDEINMAGLGYRILNLASTSVDLAGCEDIGPGHLAWVLQERLRPMAM